MTKTKKTTAIVKKPEGDEKLAYAHYNLTDILEANFGGDVAQMTPTDLMLVTVPAQGRTFELDYGEGDVEPVSTITGVIAHQQRVRRYFTTPYEASEKTPPACYSADGRQGYGHNGVDEDSPHDCATCPMNQWGTAMPREPGGNTRGKACRENVQLYVIRTDGFLPIVISVPPTSLHRHRAYMLRLADQGKAYDSVDTTLSLDLGDQSSVLTFKRHSNLDDETIERVMDYKVAIIKLIAAGEIQRRSMDDVVDGAEANREAASGE